MSARRCRKVEEREADGFPLSRHPMLSSIVAFEDSSLVPTRTNHPWIKWKIFQPSMHLRCDDAARNLFISLSSSGQYFAKRAMAL